MRVEEGRVGQRVGDFQLEELCSDGTHYAIYRGRHRKLERFAEVRIHHRQHCDDSVHRRIEETARLISKIRHPNVVELYDYGSLEDGSAYVAREWVHGKLLSESKEAPAEPGRVLAEVCEGLAAMHEVGLCHGEISTRSIMLAEGTESVKIVGPLLDRSPETRRAATVTADIEALGELIESLFAMPSASAATEAEALIPRDIDAIAKRCRAPQSESGYGSVRTVAKALRSALSDDGERDDGLAPGTLIADTYRVYAVIGAGGMGKVYEAVHKRLPQRVAIKVISGQHQPEALARFKQEAEIASSLGHPHIVRVFDFNTLPDGRPYMVMEFLEGEDLAKALSKGALPLERALAIAGQIGSGLAAAHDKGIVHRDLKPPNIFLGSVDIGGARREHATILDFGVSKKADSEGSITRTEAMIGTPRYMAPEQAMGEHAAVGPHSDQFALATIVYEMLSGRRCFGGRDLAEIIHSVCYVDPIGLERIDDSIPPAVTRAVARGMSKNPSDRFPSMADFVAALEGRARVTGAAGDDQSTEAATPPQRPDAKRGDALESTRALTPAEDATVAARPASRSGTQTADTKPSMERASANSSEPAKDTAESQDVAANSHEEAQAALPNDESSGRAPAGWVVALAALAVALVGGAVWQLRGGKDRAASVPPDARVPVAAVAIDAAHTARAPAPPDAGAPPQVADAAPQTEARLLLANSSLATSPKPEPTKKPRRASPEYSEEVLDALASADRLLRSGRYKDARKLLSREPRAGKTARGYAITVMSFCGEKNFGAATDWAPRVARPDRKRVRRYCSEVHGIELP